MRHGGVQDVLGDETQHVHGILGGAVWRGVGELQLSQVVRGHAGPNGGGEYVDAFVHARAADPLGPQQCAIGGEARDEVHLLGSREVARVVPGVNVHHLVRDARPTQRGLVRARGRGREVEDPHDRGAQDRGLRGGASSTDRVGRPATLPVGGTRQRHRDPCPGDGLSDFCRVADRPDVGVGGVLVGIDADGAGRTQL